MGFKETNLSKRRKKRFSSEPNTGLSGKRFRKSLREERAHLRRHDCAEQKKKAISGTGKKIFPKKH